MDKLPGGLRQWCTEGEAAWPGVRISEADLAQHLAALGIPTTNRHAFADDLYLACACFLGDKRALDHFEAELVPVVRSAVSRIVPSQDAIDEVAQELRERMLVGAPGRPARIRRFAGQGPLHAWLRIAATRAAIDLCRQQRPLLLVDDDAFLEAASSGKDDTHGDTKNRYAETCSQSLRQAFASLEARQRNLLRLHYLHGLSIDEIAPSFQVHRATVARWIASARESLLDATRASLKEKFDLSNDAIDSILNAVHSRIDVTMSRLLAE